jgi:hypothetical protein
MGGLPRHRLKREMECRSATCSEDVDVVDLIGVRLDGI